MFVDFLCDSVAIVGSGPAGVSGKAFWFWDNLGKHGKYGKAPGAAPNHEGKTKQPELRPQGPGNLGPAAARACGGFSWTQLGSHVKPAALSAPGLSS